MTQKILSPELKEALQTHLRIGDIKEILSLLYEANSKRQDGIGFYAFWHNKELADYLEEADKTASVIPYFKDFIYRNGQDRFYNVIDEVLQDMAFDDRVTDEEEEIRDEEDNTNQEKLDVVYKSIINQDVYNNILKRTS